MARDFTLHQYRIFLRAAELGSITRTAHALALPQPSISRSIARMESDLQVKLIERHRNGIRLTAAGERFNLHAREAVRQFDLARVAARTGDRQEALGLLREAVDSGISGAALAEDPDLALLRNDPEFGEIVATASDNER